MLAVAADGDSLAQAKDIVRGYRLIEVILLR
jgi:hypothetical protein